MTKKKTILWKKWNRLVCVLLAANFLAACGQKPETEKEDSQIIGDIAEVESGAETSENDIVESQISDTQKTPESEPTELPEKSEYIKMFGTDCIAEQTFETELSEYGGNVFFVPFAPSENNAEFRIQIIQNGNVLTEIPSYVPEKLAGKEFTSLDAVSFYDVNYDGNTDIVLIETYGNNVFAAVYYGFAPDSSDYESYFLIQEQLSDNLTARINPLTVPEIIGYLSDGKTNGKFSDYKEAYQAVSRLYELENAGDTGYHLIYFDDDDIPELAAGKEGYHTSLYTYSDGSVYTLMDHWPYGAMGNAGYEYSPRKNSLRNYNSDYAGAILYTTYMTINELHMMENVVQIETYNFDDVNQNGIPDEDEMDSFGKYGVSYINGSIVTTEECAAYDLGGYEYIVPSMSYDELHTKLNSSTSM